MQDHTTKSYRIPEEAYTQLIELRAEAEAEIARVRSRYANRIDALVADLKGLAGVPAERQVLLHGAQFIPSPQAPGA